MLAALCARRKLELLRVAAPKSGQVVLVIWALVGICRGIRIARRCAAILRHRALGDQRGCEKPN